MRRLGIDPGSVRTGLALADDDVPVATPLCTVTHKNLTEAASKVAEQITRHQIDEVVIGLALAMNGREGESARRSRRFAEQLRAVARVHVILWDERLSTVSAERALRAQGVRGKDKRGVIDQAAATLLLQSYLDAQRDRKWDDEPELEQERPELPPASARRRPPRSR